MSAPYSVPVSRPGSETPSGPSLRALLDLTTTALFACDPGGRVVWCNRAARAIVGTEPVEISGLRLVDFLHPDEVVCFMPLLDRHSTFVDPASADADVAGPVRARARHHDGSWHPMEWSAGRGRGRLPLVLVAGRDLTERWAVADALRSGEARLRAIVDHSPSPVFVQDLAGRYLLLNDRWAELAGTDPPGMLGITDERCQPVNAAVLDEVRRSVAEQGGSMTCDVSVETPAGRRDLRLTEFALRHDSGIVYATCGIATDLTDRKRVTASLAERERVLETVLRASPDVISLVDAEGKVARISEAGRKLFGDEVPASTGPEMFPGVHPDDFDEVASNFIRMATGSATRARARYRVKSSDGEWVTLDTQWQAIVDGSGEFTGAVVVSRDVSARLESEQRLQALRQGAEQASRAKSDFLSRMSHELRTPLNSILGFGQLLEMDELPVNQADAVQRILRGGRHLLDIIDEVLDISRLETGHLDLAARPVLVADMLAEAIAQIDEAAARADVFVRSTIGVGDGTAVLADRRRLVQVVQNLLSNAVKYNRPGGRVDVSCQVLRGGRVRLAVADTGRGIRVEDLGRVFEPFDRLGAEQSGIEGTGVGLALSRRLVEKMGGSLAVESVPEVGSTFSVELPGAVAGGGGGARTAHAGIAATTVVGYGAARNGSDRDLAAGDRGRATSPVTPSFRVLLVEPDLASLGLVERVLTRRPGVVVEGATRGGIALDVAKARHPELILLDLHLPDMAGSTLLERLGNDDETAGIPVAVLSAEGSPGQMRRLLGRGVAGQVTKPIDVGALLSLVDAVRAASGR